MIARILPAVAALGLLLTQDSIGIGPQTIEAPRHPAMAVKALNHSDTGAAPSPPDAPKAKIPAGFKAFRGSVFKIQYPSDFRVVPSQRSSQLPSRYNSVRFISPDGRAEFFVRVAPSGDFDKPRPDPTAVDPRTERLVATKHIDAECVCITYMTIRAKNGSYERLVCDDDSDGHDCWAQPVILAFKYRSAADYRKYKAAYLQFRYSLTLSDAVAKSRWTPQPW